MLERISEKNISGYINRVVISIGVLYITMPIVIFAFGWLRIVYAIPFSVAIIAMSIRLIIDLSERVKIDLFNRKTIVYWIICIAVVALWVFYSGIGGFSFQNDDYWFREPVYRDLITYDWPVFYNSQKETGLVYYFSYWLIPAFFSKAKTFLFGGEGEYFGRLMLYFYSVLGILVVVFFLNVFLEKCSYGTVILLIMFSGLDAIPYGIINAKIPITISHMEWWAGYFQYSSNTTQLYWVFNQSIPIWIICGILLLLYENPRCILALISLGFAYSTWAIFGLLPLGLYGFFKGGLTKLINLYNIMIPGMMMLFYGSFYISSALQSTGSIGLLLIGNDWNVVLLRYLLFILLEVYAYILICRNISSAPFYWLVVVMLTVFPVIIVIDKNFSMRASIPPLFFLMVYVLIFLERYDAQGHRFGRLRKAILICMLCIGSLTPISEIGRSIYKTSCGVPYEYIKIDSLADINSTDVKNYLVYAKDLTTISKNSFFYSYLMKR